MSAQAIERATNAAVKAWSESNTDECYASWVRQQFRAGRYWGAKEVL